jgi:hypothetical protein
MHRFYFRLFWCVIESEIFLLQNSVEFDFSIQTDFSPDVYVPDLCNFVKI